MKNKIVILALLLLVGILFSGCFVQPNPPIKPEPKKEFCKTSSDCTATCAYGCVNKQWMESKEDCEALVLFECDCINNKCVKQEIEPTEDEKTQEEIDDLFDQEIDNLPEEDLTDLEDELI